MPLYQLGMELIDLAQIRIIEGFTGSQATEINLKAGGRPGRLAEKVFVGDFDAQPVRGAQQPDEEGRPLIDLQVLLQHPAEEAAAGGDLAMHPFDVADPSLLVGAEMAAAEDHQIVTVMGCCRQAGRVEEGADPTEVEGRAIEGVAEEGALDPLAFVGALPDNRKGSGEAAGDGHPPHPTEEFHRFHGSLGKEGVGWWLNRHGNLLGG